MKRIHDFIRFFCAPLYGYNVDGDGGGGSGNGGGGAGSGGAGSGTGGGNADASGGGSNSGNGASSGTGGGAGVNGGGGTSVTSGASILNDKGEFAKGWTKSLGLPEGYETKFTTFESFAKSAYSLERMLSNGNKVAVPGPQATPEERAAFYDKLGRPAKPEDYAFKMPEKIGDKPFPKELWSPERAKAFEAVAHKLGLNKEQAAALVEFDAQQGLAAYEGQTTAAEAAKTTAVDGLKKEWGANFDKQIELAKKAAFQAGGEGLLNHPLANDPVFIKAMAAVGAMIVEDSAAGARGTQGSQLNPKAEIDAMMGDRKHPYWVRSHPGHNAAVQQMAKLRAQLHPKPAAAA